ncbi:hypothetical protein [Mesorhizobium sp.]|uniref:hypothetical protein n=1 Tax=Mesorhizobium sp. TaxID=1871066 RepID=UPI001202160F|nr:hypothetical protein [Mesorhizobium sp.]TIN84869.1 MAG: hypothetical protein E5X97_19780 [Mesorhizobium sp.]
MLKATKSAAAEVKSGLDQLRAQIADLKKRRSQLEMAPVPKEEALKRIDALMDHLTERADIFLRAEQFTERDRYVMPALGQNAATILLGFAAPLLRQRLVEKLSETYAAGDGPTADAHRQLLAKFDAELLDLELAEESLVRAAEAAGIEILRRGDADPRAVLAADSSLPS